MHVGFYMKMQCRGRMCTSLTVFVMAVMLAVSVNSTPNKQKVSTKVLILGAGAAGLAAAKTLSDNNIHDFIIVEGSNRIGGRVKSVQFGGKTVEAGANWVVGKVGNPLYDIVSSFNVTGKISDWDSVIIRNSDGVDVTDTEGEVAWSKLEIAQKSFAKTADRLKKGRKDMSARSCLDIGKWRPTTPVEKVVEIYDYDYEYGNLPGVTSCIDVDQSFPFIDDVFYVQDERGYEFLLHKYIEDCLTDNDSRLYFNEVVTRVKYNGRNVRVITETGNVFTADYVIMTFSIGVLKSGSVTFIPRLPKWKIDSLFRIRFENYLSFYLKFPDTCKRFWDDTEYILHADERRGYYPVWQNLEADGLFPSGTNILVVVTLGEEADRVGQLSDSQITTEIMEMLRRVYNDSTIPDPEEMFFNNWRNDPLYRGSFCNVEPGAPISDIVNSIKAPVKRLHFAGEALATELTGYVFGAITSGVSTASEVVRKVKQWNRKHTSH